MHARPIALPFLAALLLAGAFAAGSAFAARERGPAEAADRTQGMAIMSAVVGSDGVAAHMSGVEATARNATGNYRVTFVRDVDYATCAFSVTPLAGFAITSTIDGGRTLNVQTYAPPNGTFYNAAFSVIAVCHK